MRNETSVYYYKTAYVLAILIAMLILITIPSVSLGETKNGGADFAQYADEANRILLLDDGRILLTKKETNESRVNTITVVECRDIHGEVLWSCPVFSSDYMPFTYVIETEEGNFAFIGRMEDNVKQVTLIDQSGNKISTLTLPKGIYTPVLSKSAILYVEASGNGAAPVLCRMDWQGSVQTYPVKDVKSFNINYVLTEDDHVYLSIFYRNMDDQRITAVVKVTQNAEVAWQHDLGSWGQWNVTCGVTNDEGGITISSNYNAGLGSENDIKMYAMCLDAEGNTVWNKEVVSLNPFAHMITQNDDGTYAFWGNIVPSRDAYKTFMVQLDRQGRYIRSELKDVWGNMQPYINGEVYAIVYAYDTIRPSYLAPFSSLSVLDMEAFSSIDAK